MILIVFLDASIQVRKRRCQCMFAQFLELRFLLFQFFSDRVQFLLILGYFQFMLAKLFVKQKQRFEFLAAHRW